MVNSIDWYLRKYGEDWAEIVREEDQRLGRNSDGSYTIDRNPQTPDSSWAAHPINMQ